MKKKKKESSLMYKFDLSKSEGSVLFSWRIDLLLTGKLLIQTLILEKKKNYCILSCENGVFTRKTISKVRDVHIGIEKLSM